MSWQITYLFNHQIVMTRSNNKDTMNNDNVYYIFIICYMLKNMLNNFIYTIAFNSSNFPITKVSFYKFYR